MSTLNHFFISSCLVLLIYISHPVESNDLLKIKVERTIPRNEAQNIIRADEDDPENPENPENPDAPPNTGPGGSATSNSTTQAECEAITANSQRICCFQYTWVGYVANPHLQRDDTIRNCSQVHKQDPMAACFGPVVYAFNTTKRPDPLLVGETCRDNNHDCFCAGSTCLTYVVYENIDGQPRKNETHFCGTLTLKNTQSAVTSGCYRETKSGNIHEVCACNGGLCNSSLIKVPSIIPILISLLISAKIIVFSS